MTANIPSPEPAPRFAAFRADRLLAEGPLVELALLLAAAGEDDGEQQGTVVLDTLTGRVVDLDLRGDAAAITARYTEAPRGRGRPKLGVTGREVTLLPDQWDWLARQPGGASVMLRKLVGEAMRSAAQQQREARDRCYRLATVLAGDRPGYEEAMRALYAGDAAGFAARLAAWPEDIRHYLQRHAPR